MSKLNVENIPAELKDRNQWVTWKSINRNGQSTKIPYQVNGIEAKSNDPSTWTSFDNVMAAYNRGGYSGIGYVFSKDDPYTGIDCDCCIFPGMKEPDSWAKDIAEKLNSYAEVSPSGTGIKFFVRAKSPFDSGKNKKLPQHGSIRGREAGIEIYDHGRFFCVTGQRIAGLFESTIRSSDLEWLQSKYWPETIKKSVPWNQPVQQPNIQQSTPQTTPIGPDTLQAQAVISPLVIPQSKEIMDIPSCFGQQGL